MKKDHRWGKTNGRAASAGGVAVAFALRLCASVSLFGVGGGGHSYVDREDVFNLNDAAHNVEMERNWMDTLIHIGRAQPKCYNQASPKKTGLLLMARNKSVLVQRTVKRLMMELSEATKLEAKNWAQV